MTSRGDEHDIASSSCGDPEKVYFKSQILELPCLISY